jgi:transposase
LEREALVSNRRKFDPEFREGAVRIVLESGRPIAQVARDLGVHEGTLGNWVAKAREARGGADAPPPSRLRRAGGSPSESERAELARLRSENAEQGRMLGVAPFGE